MITTVIKKIIFENYLLTLKLTTVCATEGCLSVCLLKKVQVICLITNKNYCQYKIQ